MFDALLSYQVLQLEKHRIASFWTLIEYFQIFQIRDWPDLASTHMPILMTLFYCTLQYNEYTSQDKRHFFFDTVPLKLSKIFYSQRIYLRQTKNENKSFQISLEECFTVHLTDIYTIRHLRKTSFFVVFKYCKSVNANKGDLIINGAHEVIRVQILRF